MLSFVGMVDSFLSIGTTRQIKALLYCSDNSVLNHNSSMTYVKNASGTSRWSKPSTGESSWLEYWEKQTGKKATRCGATDCHSTGELVGGHVQKVFGGNEIYITPLCKGCNNRTDNFWVDTELVRVPSGL